VHASQRVAEHEDMRDLAVRVLANAGYHAGAGLRRLEKMFREDFLPVSEARPERAPLRPQQELATPSGFSELRQPHGQMVRRLHLDRPVIIVNGTDQAEDPDFERQPVWKILVGGAKLSRGYTIEGLTVSYFRRRAGAADTLMQMGRWFGFRQ